jgi:hypothetical protein
VWTCLPNGRSDYLSGQWFEYTGIPQAEQLNSQWLDRLIHPPDLKVLFVTGYADKFELEGSWGGDPLIMKPFSFNSAVAPPPKWGARRTPAPILKCAAEIG